MCKNVLYLYYFHKTIFFLDISLHSLIAHCSQRSTILNINTKLYHKKEDKIIGSFLWSKSTPIRYSLY